jgi:hypothetical protein
MIRRIVLVAGLAALAGTGPDLLAQPAAARNDSAQAPVHPGTAPPFIALFGQREKLALTSAQVTVLDSVSEAMKERNRGLTRRYRAIRDSIAGRGTMREGERRRVMAAARPVLLELRESHRSASLAVRDVLDEAQRTQVCAMFGPRDAAGGPGLRQTRDRRPGEGTADVDEPWEDEPGDADIWGGAPDRQRRPDGTWERPRWPVRGAPDAPRPEAALFWCPPPAAAPADSASAS